jgi:putative colanic acid biosynthesis acetyltransferase WcaF
MARPEPAYLGQGCRSPYSWRELARRRLWALVQATLFRWSPERCHRWRAWLLKIFGADIPDTDAVVIFPTTTVHFPWQLRLEPRSMVGRDVRIYNLARITLRRGANISQCAHLCAGSHDYREWAMPLVRAEIVIGENAWIAADVFVGPGVTIGELAVVGARSVVVSDLPARMVCVGHPCRPVKPRPEPK